MPILPQNRHLYPADWPAIRIEILNRADHTCEQCGLENHTTITRTRKGQPHPIRIVLTIAHLDHDPTNNGTPGDRPNLKALCQQCHNRHDATHRGQTRRLRRLLKTQAHT